MGGNRKVAAHKGVETPVSFGFVWRRIEYGLIRVKEKEATMR
jgi:hypothetical protein